MGEQENTYQMRRVIHIAMRAELSLDVLVAEHPHFLRKIFSVRAEQASVERDGRKQGHRRSPQALGDGG